MHLRCRGSECEWVEEEDDEGDRVRTSGWRRGDDEGNGVRASVRSVGLCLRRARVAHSVQRYVYAGNGMSADKRLCTVRSLYVMEAKAN